MSLWRNPCESFWHSRSELKELKIRKGRKSFSLSLSLFIERHLSVVETVRGTKALKKRALFWLSCPQTLCTQRWNVTYFPVGTTVWKRTNSLVSRSNFCFCLWRKTTSSVWFSVFAAFRGALKIPINLLHAVIRVITRKSELPLWLLICFSLNFIKHDPGLNNFRFIYFDFLIYLCIKSTMKTQYAVDSRQKHGNTLRLLLLCCCNN